MAKTASKNIETDHIQKKNPHHRTSEAREGRLVNLAMIMAEELLENKTAPTAVLVHFLRAGEEKAKLERMKLEADTRVAIAKVQIMESQKRYEQIAQEALDAMRLYAGIEKPEDEDYDE